MAIIIKMREGKWQLKIEGEIWEFSDSSSMKETLSKIIFYKDIYVPKNKMEVN